MEDSNTRQDFCSCTARNYRWGMCDLEDYDMATDIDDWVLSRVEELLVPNNRFADMTIICGDRTWNVHRAIVCTSCRFFEKALDGNWKAGCPEMSGMTEFTDVIPDQEAHDNTINLSVHAPWMIDRLLEFIYTGQYSGYCYTSKPQWDHVGEDLDANCNKCSTLLTKDQLCHGLDESIVPATFDSPTISERVTSWGFRDSSFSPERIREGLWISLQMYLLGDRYGISKLCIYAAAQFLDYGSLFSTPQNGNPPNVKYSWGFVDWLGKILVTIIDPLYSTLPPVSGEKRLLHRKLCHLLMRFARIEEHRARVIPMMQKHPEFLTDYVHHLAQTSPDADKDVRLMNKETVRHLLGQPTGSSSSGEE